MLLGSILLQELWPFKLLDNFFAISQLFVFGDMVDFLHCGGQMCTNVKIIGVIAKIASSVYFIFCLCDYMCMYVCMLLFFFIFYYYYSRDDRTLHFACFHLIINSFPVLAFLLFI